MGLVLVNQREWYCGIDVLWYCGTVLLWYCGSVVVWYCNCTVVLLWKSGMTGLVLVNQSESHKTCPSASPSPLLAHNGFGKGFSPLSPVRRDDDAELEKRKVSFSES